MNGLNREKGATRCFERRWGETIELLARWMRVLATGQTDVAINNTLLRFVEPGPYGIVPEVRQQHSLADK
jgi:hypothetical protein